MMLYKTFITNCKTNVDKKRKNIFNTKAASPRFFWVCALEDKELNKEGPWGICWDLYRNHLYCTVRNTNTTNMCLCYWMCINVGYFCVFYGPEKNGLIATSRSMSFVIIMYYQVEQLQGMLLQLSY